MGQAGCSQDTRTVSELMEAAFMSSGAEGAAKYNTTITNLIMNNSVKEKMAVPRYHKLKITYEKRRSRKVIQGFILDGRSKIVQLVCTTFVLVQRLCHETY